MDIALDAAGAVGEMLGPDGADEGMLYPDGAVEAAADEAAAEVFEEPDDIKAEMSSWPLSGRTRDDDPTWTVFAYDEMYLRSVSSDAMGQTGPWAYQFCFSGLQFETSLLVRPTVKVALAPGTMVNLSNPLRTFGASFGPPRLTYS
jgi:hypothetical protein